MKGHAGGGPLARKAWVRQTNPGLGLERSFSRGEPDDSSFVATFLGARTGFMESAFRAELSQRRSDVLKQLEGGVLVLFSAPVHTRNGDVEHTFRQDSDFFYLSGIEEPECALVLSEATGLVLFVRPKNRERETWEGRRMGVEGAVDEYGANAAHPVSELETRLADYLEDQPIVHYLIGQESEWDRRIIEAVNAVRARRRKRVAAPGTIKDARNILHEMRLFKSDFEQEKMAQVAKFSAAAHCRAMQLCEERMPEWQLQNIVESEFRRLGCQRLAYDSIVGSGENATILHYRENTRTMLSGDMVLIDAGAEYDYYAADITRTFPVNGKFSSLQARVYRAVLESQLAAIDRSVVGATLDEIHDVAWQVLKGFLRNEGLIDDHVWADEEEAKKRVNRFFMHRTSHYLGMDVHDVGSYFEGKDARLLAEGVVITVEPGLYFANDDETVPAEYRGLGIRIEDDVLITQRGPRVLTNSVPKTVEDIEEMCHS